MLNHYFEDTEDYDATLEKFKAWLYTKYLIVSNEDLARLLEDPKVHQLFEAQK